VKEEANPEVRPERSQHVRDKAQVVIVNPDGTAGGCGLGDGAGKASVDPVVGVPPVAVVLGHMDVVVI